MRRVVHRRASNLPVVGDSSAQAIMAPPRAGVERGPSRAQPLMPCAAPWAGRRVGYRQGVHGLLDGMIADGMHLAVEALPLRLRRRDAGGPCLMVAFSRRVPPRDLQLDLATTVRELLTIRKIVFTTKRTPPMPFAPPGRQFCRGGSDGAGCVVYPQTVYTDLNG
jgi:hypothetical protein